MVTIVSIPLSWLKSIIFKWFLQLEMRDNIHSISPVPSIFHTLYQKPKNQVL